MFINCSISRLINHSAQVILAGATLELGRPISARVRFYSKHTGALVKMVNSNSDGSFKVLLPRGTYTISAFSINKNFNAVIQDNVVPK